MRTKCGIGFQRRRNRCPSEREDNLETVEILEIEEVHGEEKSHQARIGRRKVQSDKSNS
jgi:hypothetical protein